jgi:hypothetical protein
MDKGAAVSFDTTQGEVEVGLERKKKVKKGELVGRALPL